MSIRFLHFNSEMLIMSVSRRVATQLAGVTPASFFQLRSKQGEYNEDNRFKEKADKSHSGCYYDGFRNVC